MVQEPLLHLKEVSTEGNGAKDNNMVQNLYSSIEQDDEYSNSNLTNCDENVPIKRSNQHNMVGVDEGFKWPSNLEYLFNGDLIPTVISLLSFVDADYKKRYKELSCSCLCFRNYYMMMDYRFTSY